MDDLRADDPWQSQRVMSYHLGEVRLRPGDGVYRRYEGEETLEIICKHAVGNVDHETRGGQARKSTLQHWQCMAATCRTRRFMGRSVATNSVVADAIAVAWDGEARGEGTVLPGQDHYSVPWPRSVA